MIGGVVMLVSMWLLGEGARRIVRHIVIRFKNNNPEATRERMLLFKFLGLLFAFLLIVLVLFVSYFVGGFVNRAIY